MQLANYTCSINLLISNFMCSNSKIDILYFTRKYFNAVIRLKSLTKKFGKLTFLTKHEQSVAHKSVASKSLKKLLAHDLRTKFLFFFKE